MKNLSEKSIFSGQRVSHRKGAAIFPLPRTSGKIAYRPVGYNSHSGQNKNLIDTIKQRPARVAHPRRIKKEKPFKQKVSPGLPRRPFTIPKIFKFSFKTANRPSFSSILRREEQQDRRPSQEPGQQPLSTPAKPEKERKPFSFPLIPAAVLTGSLAFSILAVTWQGIPETWIPGKNMIPDLPEDNQFLYDMGRYAGFNPDPAAEEGELIPLSMPQTFAWESYRVKKGDSVSKIAMDFAISMDAVIASNGIANVRRLQEGQILRIPNMNGIPYTVKQGDSLSRISSGMGVPLEAILDANNLTSGVIRPGTVLFIPGAKMKTEELKLAMGELFIYPIRGRLTSPFGWRDDPFTRIRTYHTALDLAASMGTPVKAAMDGKVSSIGVNSIYGNYIILTHAGGYQTMYAHLSKTSVFQGVSVLQGSKIGEVGSTGKSTGPHLHFAVYKNGRAVNPLDYLGS